VVSLLRRGETAVRREHLLRDAPIAGLDRGIDLDSNARITTVARALATVGPYCDLLGLISSRLDPDHAVVLVPADAKLLE
jgi:hypothetical protein